ncbi:hypothetical protein OE09_2047 [Flavobacteriaceae bacterium MAR_2010_72]|nr:hypothetical protein OE09_2047 [Flavobacteriaceae bacterium MAR_2010_72]
MEDYFYPQIVEFKEIDIDQKIIGNTYEFHLNSTQSDIDGTILTGKVTDLNLASNNGIPFSFVVMVVDKNITTELLINSIKKMKYVC